MSNDSTFNYFYQVGSTTKTFVPTKGKISCEVCGDVSGKCRITPKNLLCMTFLDGFGYDTNRFVYTGRNSNGTWGKFVFKNHNDRTEKIKWQPEFHQKTEKVTLGERERDKAIRAMRDSLGLITRHRHDLRKRGLSEEAIEQGLFFSLNKGENPMPSSVPMEFPGVQKKGNQKYIYSRVSGYACVSFNEKGQATGFQIRNDTNNDGNPKYLWLKDLHLKNNEMPLTTINLEMVKEGKIPLLVEGILKPFIVAHKFNAPVIGASGGSFVGSMSQLKRMLGDQKEVIIVPDAGDVVNTHTQGRWTHLINQLERLGLTVQVMWWDQIAKSDRDIDELDTLEGIYLIDGQEFTRIINGYCESGLSFTNGIKKLFNHCKGFFVAKKNKKKPNTITYSRGKEFLIPTKEEWQKQQDEKDETKGQHKQKNLRIVFRQGDQIFLILALIAKGWTDIVDKSFMGLGKSHSIGLLSRSNGKLFYLDVNHRNVSTETVASNYTDLNPRHNGFVYAGGRTVKAYGSQVNPAEGNCHLFHVFEKALQKGHNFNEDNVICRACQFKEKCKKESGEGYGYLKERRETLQQPKIRCHPYSLPSAEDYDYSNAWMIAEEASQVLNPFKTIGSKWIQLLAGFDLIEQKHCELYEAIAPLKYYFRDLMNKRTSLYGLTDEEIRGGMPEFPRGMEWAMGMIKGLLFDYRFEGTNEEVLKQIEELTTNVLYPLLKVILDPSQGSLRITNGYLNITLKDDRSLESFKAAAVRIYLDTTMNVPYTAKLLNKDESDFVIIQQETPDFSNLTVYSTYMEGLGSKERSAKALEQIRRFKEYYCMKHGIDVKFLGMKGEDQIDGWWFNHNRGTNIFKGVQYYVSFGLPFPNVGVIQDQYRAVYGSLEGFEEHYQHSVEAEILQNIGRQRTHLYPSQTFVIDFVNSKPQFLKFLSEYGIKVNFRTAFEATGDIHLASENQARRIAILEGLHTLAQKGMELTQQNLAELLGMSQQLISYHCKAFQGAWRGLVQKYKSIYKDTNRPICIFSEDLDRLIREWLELPLIDLVKEVLEIISTEGFSYLSELIAQTSIFTQAEFWATLLPVFTPEMRSSLDDFLPNLSTSA